VAETIPIPEGYGVPLVDLATKLLPAPTMEVLDERYEVVLPEPSLGLVEYPSWAALDAVVQTETGILPWNTDLATFFNEPVLLEGVSGSGVTTTYLAEWNNWQHLRQVVTVANANYWETVKYTRVRPQYTAGVWEPWGLWYSGEPSASTSMSGVVVLATNSDVQNLPPGDDGVITVEGLRQASTNAATANRFMRRDGNGRAKVANPSANDDIATKVYADTLAWAAVPATPTSTGVAGAKARDANFLYICVSTNTWRRTPLSTW
jgi:hypothetical protein